MQVFAIVGFLAALCFASQAPAADRPNFVLLMADDQGYGDVAYNGHPTLKTPVLDEMAASGLRFNRFHAAAPVCSPTRGSVLTGRHPNRFACFSWGARSPAARSDRGRGAEIGWLYNGPFRQMAPRLPACRRGDQPR